MEISVNFYHIFWTIQSLAAIALTKAVKLSFLLSRPIRNQLAQDESLLLSISEHNNNNIITGRKTQQKELL